MAMCNNERVYPINIPLNHYKNPLDHCYVGNMLEWNPMNPMNLTENGRSKVRKVVPENGYHRDFPWILW